ncbi:MAG: hypothetical protein RBU25_09135 [Lentisphaeria bacterium]|jgi:hypothetical protein|nr:hypothetical protein [Lentisphaeria bacterium]
MRRHPFTFAEVLVAVLVVALVVPVAVRGIALARRLVGDDVQLEWAARLADEKLNELQVTGEWENGDSEGVFEDEPEYGWTLTTESFEPDTSLPVTVLRLTVSRTAAVRPTEVTLVSLTTNPTVMEE